LCRGPDRLPSPFLLIPLDRGWHYRERVCINDAGLLKATSSGVFWAVICRLNILPGDQERAKKWGRNNHPAPSMRTLVGGSLSRLDLDILRTGSFLHLLPMLRLEFLTITFGIMQAQLLAVLIAFFHAH